MLDDVERRRRALLDELDRVRDLLDELARDLEEPIRADDAAPPEPRPEPDRDTAVHDAIARLPRRAGQRRAEPSGVGARPAARATRPAARRRSGP